MTLDVDIGRACECGRRQRNDDCAGVRRAAPHEAGRGLVAAVADGVSAGSYGYEAAQTTVRALLDDYFATPDTWETTVALDRVIAAQNDWLAATNRRRAEGAAMTTLTALVLEARGFTVAHVGDSRAWRLRDGELARLTQDHGFDHADFAGQLTRAVGLDERVRVDYLQGELRAGDRFVLTTDGVHGALPPRRLAGLLRLEGAQAAADALVREAIAAGSHDNATALVVDVRSLDAEALDDALRRARGLPVPGRLRPGDRLDRFTITATVADDGVHRLLQARDAADGALVAIKTLAPARAADPEERAMLAHEAWLARRVAAHDARGFVPLREVEEPSALYLAYDWMGGRTLEQRLADGTRATVAEVVDAAVQLARALARLHRLGIVHRDVKPANLLRGDDGCWRLLDLGVALSGRELPAQRGLHAGTPSYMNPEQWADPPAAPDAASDLYALGVVLYRWLAGRLPWGEIEPYQRNRWRRDPTPPSRLRPEVPIWLDHLVLRAIARDPKLRFETAEELLLSLERGASRPLPAPPATPLVERDAALLWKIGLAISLAFNVLLAAWLLWLPR